MAENAFATVVLGAALADGLQKIADSIEIYRMEVEETIRELEAEQE